MPKRSLVKLVYAALFAALTFVGTFYLHVTLPFGYFNLGDAVLLIAAFMLGGGYGAVATALGAALADVALGFAAYAPATLVIKAAMALAAWGIATALSKRGDKARTGGHILAAVVAETVMVGGYYLYDSLLYGFVPALASVPGNLLQGAVGVVAGVAGWWVLRRVKL